MPSIPINPTNITATAPQAPALLSPMQLIVNRGDSGWHLKLDHSTDKKQAESLLTGYFQQLSANPEFLSQMAQLPNGQALIESLEAASQGQLTDQHVRALQTFLSRTAGIDIGYSGTRGIDGLLGPRTLDGLQSLFEKLHQSATTASTENPTLQQSDYLSSLEISATESKQPVLTNLNLFNDQIGPADMYERSPYHDDSKFVPTFGMTAYHESGSYRKPSDPYAVGAITRPSKRQDLGGKTYGSYQFESSVYPDGSTRGASKVQNSTLMRFVKWNGNPFKAQLKAAVDQYGPGSAQFDLVWKQLTAQQNKMFGEAQQAFLLHERTESVEAFMDRAQLSSEVRQDPRIIDLIMGTTNHVGGLADSAANHVARLQRQAGRPLNANEVGRAIAEYKETKIASWFQSSPEAWRGLKNRFNDEGSQFA